MAASPAGHHPNTCYIDQDGDFHVDGSAGFYNSDGNDIAAQLDDLDAISTAEFGYVDGVTAGTITASKAAVVDANQEVDIWMVTTETVTPNNDSGAASSITAGATNVTVAAVTNDANDWIVLPAIADVPIGHQIRIACNAGGNFEMRTVASSGTTINGVDSDGTNEYLCTDTEVIFVTKATTTGYVASALTALGAVATAVVPD